MGKAGSATAVVTARLPRELAAQIEELVQATPGATTADFVRTAVEHEVQRRGAATLRREVTLPEIGKKLDQVLELMGRQLTDARGGEALLKLVADQNSAIGAAMGVNIPRSA
jgi:Arc/MetJ-type ribon-helix-helix transcriptional regulator